MKVCCTNQRNRALARIDVMVIIAVLFVLAAFLLPVLTTAKRRAQRINCTSNLRQVGIVYELWQRDHHGLYPVSLSVTNGGAFELVTTGNVAAYFLTMADYVATPKILNCPADSRVEAESLTPWVGDPNGLNNSNISYFVGLNADKTRPQTIISGDDNFAVGDGVHPHPTDNSGIGDIPVKSGLLEFSSNTPIWWTGARHEFVGNIAFSDGHVQQTGGDELQRALQETGLATNRLVIP